MAVKITPHGKYRILSLTKSDMAYQSVQGIEEALERLIIMGDRDFVLDCTGLPEIASQVLGVIGYLFRKTKERGCTLSVILDRKEMVDAFNLAGFNDLVRIYGKAEELSETGGEAGELRTVLVVEDAQAVRELLGKYVERLGYRALTAENGRKGVEMALAERPDIVLTDINLPEKDGYQVCREVKSRIPGQPPPVIFITASRDPGGLLKALEAGGDDYIFKPFTEEELVFRLRTHLKMRDLNQNLKSVNENLEKLVERKSESLKETERQLYQAEKLSVIGTMLSGMAHELRNPICAINGYAQLLRVRTTLTDKQQEMVRQIEGQAVRTNTLIENFLNLTRKKYGSVTMFHINDLVENLKTNFSYIIAEKNIEIETQLAARNLLKGNATEIEQVVINLFSNAVDAIEKNGRVCISTRETAGDTVLEIEDDGCGMPPEIQKKIFDPFYTTKEPGKGTGLGLSIVMKIIEDHRGKVTMTSEPGKGTRFTVTLPMPK